MCAVPPGAATRSEQIAKVVFCCIPDRSYVSKRSHIIISRTSAGVHYRI